MGINSAMEEPIKLNIKVIENVSSSTFQGTAIALGGGVIQNVTGAYCVRTFPLYSDLCGELGGFSWGPNFRVLILEKEQRASQFKPL